MGKTKKKLTEAAPKESTAGKSSGDNPPTPRKRGRPRKAVAKETAKTEEAETIEEKQPEVSEDADAGSKGGSQKKRQIESSGAAGSNKKGGEEKEGSSEESPPKLKAARREGSRRKSEPRRAAGSLVPGR